MRALVPEFGFGGLNTKARSTGLPVLDAVHLQDMRIVGTDLVQRLGMVRFTQVSPSARAADFNAGASEHCSNTIDTRVWELGLNWTLEVCIEPDTTSGTMGLVTAGHTTPSMILDITGGNIRFRIWDSAATLTTITVGAAATSVQTVQVTRNGATLSTRLNNGTAVTDTMSATLSTRSPVGDLRLARDDTTNYYDGTIDYVRLFSYTKANHADRLIRFPNPRADSVLADYDFDISTANLVYDRSRYASHLIAQNTPTEVTSLSHTPAPVRALGLGRDSEQKKQAVFVAGALYYIADMD